MFYYEIAVASSKYNGTAPLTYQYSQPLKRGALVTVPLRAAKITGVVMTAIEKPGFATKAIIDVPELPPLADNVIRLMLWLAEYYPASLGVVTQQFLPKSLSYKQLRDVDDGHIAHTKSLDVLSPEQRSAVNTITKQPDTYILHGETGSGKTRVYVELALLAFAQGLSSIVLTPEIGLTPQLAQTFVSTFGESNVIVTHSQLSESQRRHLWLSMLHAVHPLIVIGPRSALFSPLRKIGLIVVDEAHEPSYKQDQLPHYHASKVAAKLAELHHATLVLGSATPSINDYFLAEHRGKPIIRIQKLATTVHTPTPAPVHVIDLKDKAQFTVTPYLSVSLIAAITQALNRSEQSLLFLNRRGTARVILCDACGWQAVCPHCDLPTTYHADSYTLRCHTCGFHQSAVSSCPICGNANIVLKSIGTKAIAQTVSALFPEARVQRFDTDNQKGERIEHHYEALKSGKVDILIGTQLLAKGLDLPKLSVVGIVISDTSLYFPDYSAGERTYQLIRQVVGRVGRGHRDSTVIVQTYDPDNAILQSAIQKDWQKFYQSELKERRKYMFPPFCYLLKLTCRRASAKSAETTAQKLAHNLRVRSLKIAIDGPSPSYYERIGNKYQWQLVVKSKDRRELLKVIKSLPADWSYDIDPLNLL